MQQLSGRCAHVYGDGVARDLERAASSFAKACHIGEALGCANYGYMLEHGVGVRRDTIRARVLYRDACASGDPYGCLHAQMMDAQDAGGKKAPRDPRQALSYWRRACDERKDSRACAFVGIMYDDGPDGFDRDEVKSGRAMQRACDLGMRLACEWKKAHPVP